MAKDRLKLSDSTLAFYKLHLLDLIEMGKPWTKAAREMNLSPSTVQYWQRTDVEFGQRFKEAVALCTEVRADSALTLHEDIADAKVAKVASDNLWRWLAARNPKTFGAKIEVNESQPQLLNILQAAVSRLIEQVPALPKPLVTDARALLLAGAAGEGQAEPVKQLRDEHP
jgi:hypothetical protein